MTFEQEVRRLLEQQESFLSRRNTRLESNNNIYHRYQHPVLTWEHTPAFRRDGMERQSRARAPHRKPRCEVLLRRSRKR